MKSRKIRSLSFVEETITSIKYHWYTGNRAKFLSIVTLFLLFILVPTTIVIGGQSQSFFPFAAETYNLSSINQKCTGVGTNGKECGHKGSCNSNDQICQGSGTSNYCDGNTGVCKVVQGGNCDPTQSEQCVQYPNYVTTCRTVTGTSDKHCMAKVEAPGDKCTIGYAECTSGMNCYQKDSPYAEIKSGSGVCGKPAGSQCTPGNKECAPGMSCRNQPAPDNNYNNKCTSYLGQLNQKCNYSLGIRCTSTLSCSNTTGGDGTCQTAPTSTPTPVQCEENLKMEFLPGSSENKITLKITNKDEPKAGSCPSSEIYSMNYDSRSFIDKNGHSLKINFAYANFPLTGELNRGDSQQIQDYITLVAPADATPDDPYKYIIIAKTKSGKELKSTEQTYKAPKQTSACNIAPTVDVIGSDSNVYTGPEKSHLFSVKLTNNDPPNANCLAKNYDLTFNSQRSNITVPTNTIHFEKILAAGDHHTMDNAFQVSIDTTNANTGSFRVIATSTDSSESGNIDVTYTYDPGAATPIPTEAPCVHDATNLHQECSAIWVDNADNKYTVGDKGTLYYSIKNYASDKKTALDYVTIAFKDQKGVVHPNLITDKNGPTGGNQQDITLQLLSPGTISFHMYEKNIKNNSYVAEVDTGPIEITAAESPGEPTATTAPGAPTATTAPDAPTATTAPGEPTATTAPGEPTATTAPGEPTATTAPGEPTATTAPGEPTATGSGPATHIAFSISLQSIAVGPKTGNGFKVNNNPVTRKRPVTVMIYSHDQDPAIDDPLVSKEGTVTYNPATGFYTSNNFDIGNQLTATGQYKVLVQTSGFLRKSLGTPIITVGAKGKDNVMTTPNSPPVLFAGDVNSDNAIDILDYSMLISCFSTSGGGSGGGSSCDAKAVDFNDKPVPATPDGADALLNDELNILLTNFTRQFGD